MKNGFTTSENWNIGKINYIMDTLYKHLIYLRNNFNLEDSTTIIKKERSVGIIPNSGCRILREQLEEMVLSCSRKLNTILRHRQISPIPLKLLC